MTARLKPIGLALIVVFAIAAGAAPAAQGAQFTTAEYPATLAGAQTKGLHKFVFSEWVVECEEASFSTTLTEAAKTVTVTPEYPKCHAIPEELPATTPATIKTNGCDYVYHVEVEDTKTLFTGSTTIKCPAGKKIEILLYISAEAHAKGTLACVLKFGEQTAAGKVTFEGEGSDVRVDTALTGIVHEGVGLKTVCGPTTTGASYSGSTTETAKNSKSESIALMIG